MCNRGLIMAVNSETISAKVKKLRIGKSFRVPNDLMRRYALTAARVLNIKLHTSASNGKRGGFTVTRLPE